MKPLTTSIDQLKTNDRQWEAFTTQGHCVVLAPPGSGKTKLLTTRMAYDLINVIPRPQGAACVTLTIAATNELRRRVLALGVAEHPTLFISTVHSFALNKIVLPFAHIAGRPEIPQLSIASGINETTAFNAALASVYPQGADTKYIQSTIEVNRKQFASDEAWARHDDKVREVARRYLANLHEAGFIDFLEVIEVAVNIVENYRTIRKVLTARYPHLYVDEYQDLAPGLDRLVKALCFDYGPHSELFAVGDPDQAVMAFTGTRPELLKQLAQHPQVRPVQLENNYRCGQEIIAVANPMKESSATVIGDREGGIVDATHCPRGLNQQSQTAAQLTLELNRAGTPLHEIVVICPMNKQCETAAEVFRQAGVPSFFRNTDYYRPITVTSFIEGCAAWSTMGRERSHYRLAELLQQWRYLVGQGATHGSDVALTQLLIDWHAHADDSAHTLIASLGDIGLTRALGRISLADEAIEVTKMRTALTTGPLRTLTVRHLAERARRVDRVEITTMNSSKGLEFDAVIILAMEEGLVPFFSAYNKPADMAESRRKFYVALTRARNEVHIYYSGFIDWGPGKRPSRNGPSSFLREIGVV